MGEVELIARRGVNVRSGLPLGPLSEAEGQAFRGKSQPKGLETDAAAHGRRTRVFGMVRFCCSGEQLLRLGVAHFMTSH